MTSPEHARRLLAAADPATTATLDRADLTELRATPHHPDARLDPILDAAPDRAARRAQVVDLSTRRRLGRRTSIALSLAVLTAAGGTAAAVALRHDPTPELVGVECALSAHDSVIIGRTTLDPIEACRRVTEAGGAHMPDDVDVYRLDGRALIVAPPSAAPQGATKVSHGPVADTRVVEFLDAIEDRRTGVGGGSGCHTEAQTRAFVEAARARLHIEGYPTTAPTRSGACVWATIDDAADRVLLLRADHDDVTPHPNPAPKPGTPDYEAFWADVHRSLVAPAPTSDWSGEQVESSIHAAAARYGIPRSAYSVEVAPTSVGDTLRVYEYEPGEYRIYTP